MRASSPYLIKRRRPSLIVVGGPTAVGKSHLIDTLLQLAPDEFQRPRSYTTRDRRVEEDDREYVFVSATEFHQLEVRDNLLNVDEVYGSLYGIARDSVTGLLARGTSVIKEIHPDNQPALGEHGLPLVRVLLIPIDWEAWRARAAERDPTRAREDEAYYRRVNYSQYDLVCFVFENEDAIVAAAHFLRKLRSHLDFGEQFPHPGFIDDTNANGYDRVAPEFVPSRRITTANFHQLSQPFFADAITRLGNGEACLELGPGSGWLRREFEWPDVCYVGLDISQEMLAQLGESDQLRGGSARTLPWPSDRFDWVLASLADPYLHPTVFAEVRRVLKPGGRFIFSTPAREWSDALRASANRQSSSFAIGTEFATVFSFTYTVDELRLLLETTDYHVVTLDSLLGSALCLPISPALTEAAQKAFVELSELPILQVCVALAAEDV